MTRFKVMNFLKRIIYRLIVLMPVNVSHHRLLRRIRKRGTVKVMFLASNLSMWKYEKLIDRLIADDRFEISIALVPFLRYDENERRRKYPCRRSP